MDQEERELIEKHRIEQELYFLEEELKQTTEGSTAELRILIKEKNYERLHLNPKKTLKYGLQSIDFSFNDIQPDESFYLKFRNAIQFSEIKSINLHGNKLGNEGIIVIASGLTWRSQLEKLDVSKCDFNMTGAD